MASAQLNRFPDTDALLTLRQVWRATNEEQQTGKQKKRVNKIYNCRFCNSLTLADQKSFPPYFLMTVNKAETYHNIEGVAVRQFPVSDRLQVDALKLEGKLDVNKPGRNTEELKVKHVGHKAAAVKDDLKFTWRSRCQKTKHCGFSSVLPSLDRMSSKLQQRYKTQ